MKLNIRTLIGGGAKLLLPLLLINSAFADSSTDARIQAYKANKLIPQNIVLPTSTGAADSDKVVVFSPSKLTWASDAAGSVAIKALLGKFGTMTADDWESFDFSDPSAEDALEYLSAIYREKLESDALSKDDAAIQLQACIDKIKAGETINGKVDCMNQNIWDLALFTFKEEVDGDSLYQYLELPNSVDYTTLDFTDTEDTFALTGEGSFTFKFPNNLTDKERLAVIAQNAYSADLLLPNKDSNYSYYGALDMSSLDFSQLSTSNFTNRDLRGSNISITQLSTVGSGSYSGCILPELNLKPGDSFNGKRFNNGCDFSYVVGLTGDILSTAGGITAARFTSAQYTALKEQIAQFNCRIYVDGVQKTAAQVKADCGL